MNQIIIGLVGEKGGGKETFAKILQHVLKHIPSVHIRFSDILTDTLRFWGLPTTRENLQKLSMIMNESFGEGVLARALENRIVNHNAQIIILDGLRWPSDLGLIKRFPQSFLVYITADAKKRYLRIRNRQEKKGEDTVTFRQFMNEEKILTEKMIKQIGKKADFTIINNDTLKNFEKEVRRFCRAYLKLS